MLVTLKNVVRGAVVLYVGLCLAMFLLQTRLPFHPTADPGPPTAFGLADFRTVKFTTDDGFVLTGWFHEDPGHDKALVYFYGNADSLAGSPSLLRDLADAGYTVLA